MFRTRHHILALLLAALAGETRACNFSDRTPVSAVEAMIEQAEPGSLVTLLAGVYEGNLVVRKPVVLDGSAGAVFDGLGKGTVIEVLAENVTIRGCTVRASGEDVMGEPSAIRVLAANATIDSNMIEDALFGIDLREASGTLITGNVIYGKDLDPGRRGDGIRLWASHGCTVEGNTVRASRDMVFWYSEDLRIARNTVSDSRYGLHFMYSHGSVLEENELYANSVGVYLMYSNGITLRGNRMLNNRGASGYGLGLKDCDDIAIIGNAMLANRVGVYIDNSPSSVNSHGLFESNMIAFNESGLLATPNTHSNVFTGNAFIENEEAAATHGRGRLVSNIYARNGIGNYWSDYAGFDLDGDGIGDVQHEPRSLFGVMLANEPNLRIFVHSPAQQAIEFTSRALPELRPESTLIDPFPLTYPPAIELVFTGSERSAAPMVVLSLSMLALVAGFVALMTFERDLSAYNVGGRT